MAELAFRTDGTFTIAQFTDTHLQDALPADDDTYALMARVIDGDRPDLVVLSGDIVHPTWSRDPVGTWRRLVAFLDGKGIPWTFVYGNHDAQEWEYAVIDGLLAEGRCSLYDRGPADLTGHGNWALPILRSGGAREIGAIVWGLDSGMGDDAKGLAWGYVAEDQVAWFRSEADRLIGARRDGITGLLFMHNPVPQYDGLWQTRACTGYRYEKVCMQDRDMGLFDAMQGRVVASFVGHDHVNDYEGRLGDVDLVYGRCTGYNCYGAEGFQRGARIIRVSVARRGYETFIRLADGTIAPRPVHQPGEPVVAPKGTRRAAEAGA